MERPGPSQEEVSRRIQTARSSIDREYWEDYEQSLHDEWWNKQKVINHNINLSRYTGWYRGVFYWRGVPQQNGRR